MATVTEMRAWLKGEGHDVPERGRLTAEWTDLYNAGHQEDDADWDLAGGDELASADELEPEVPMQPERPPRTAKTDRQERRSRGETRTDQIVGRLLSKPKDSKAKPTTRAKKKPRVSVEHLVSRGWEAIAKLSAPLSLPMSRCLQVQSPVAGMILEDIVAGTVVDRVLQPVARAEEKAEKVLALVAPPILVLAIEQSQQLPPEQMMMRQAFLVPMLKESLRVWLQVAGPKVEEAARKEAEYQEKFGQTIDEMIGLFFPPPPETKTERTPEPEMAEAAA